MVVASVEQRVKDERQDPHRSRPEAERKGKRRKQQRCIEQPDELGRRHPVEQLQRRLERPPRQHAWNTRMQCVTAETVRTVEGLHVGKLQEIR